jgi:hypothetical protein
MSMGALAIFLAIYFRSIHLKEQALAILPVMLTAIGAGLMPAGGGGSILAVYPAVHAGRLRPRRAALGTIPACIIVFLITGLLSGQPFGLVAAQAYNPESNWRGSPVSAGVL